MATVKFRSVKTGPTLENIGAGVLELGERLSVPGFRGLISIVKAEVGRPLTPIGVAGVGAAHGAAQLSAHVLDTSRSTTDVSFGTVSSSKEESQQ